MKIIIHFYCLFCLSNIALSQDTIFFESHNLKRDTFINHLDNGSGFEFEEIVFHNTYSAEYDYWNGWSLGNIKDQETRGFSNQYAAKTIDTLQDNTWAIAYSQPTIKSKNKNGFKLHEFKITNSVYTYFSLKEGDQFANKFGGESGDNPDYFSVDVIGVRGTDTILLKTIALADYRFDDNSKDYIVNDWMTVKMDKTPVIDSIFFDFFTTDYNQYGSLTPLYFCMDDMVVSPGVDTVAIHNKSNNLDVSIYPNPVRNHFNIEAQSPVKFIRLYDSKGAVYHYENTHRVETDQLPSGVYFIEIQSIDNLVYRSKILIQ